MRLFLGGGTVLLFYLSFIKLVNAIEPSYIELLNGISIWKMNDTQIDVAMNLSEESFHSSFFSSTGKLGFSSYNVVSIAIPNLGSNGDELHGKLVLLDEKFWSLQWDSLSLGSWTLIDWMTSFSPFLPTWHNSDIPSNPTVWKNQANVSLFVAFHSNNHFTAWILSTMLTTTEFYQGTFQLIPNSTQWIINGCNSNGTSFYGMCDWSNSVFSSRPQLETYTNEYVQWDFFTTLKNNVSPPYFISPELNLSTPSIPLHKLMFGLSTWTDSMLNEYVIEMNWINSTFRIRTPQINSSSSPPMNYFSEGYISNLIFHINVTTFTSNGSFYKAQFNYNENSQENYTWSLTWLTGINEIWFLKDINPYPQPLLKTVEGKELVGVFSLWWSTSSIKNDTFCFYLEHDRMRIYGFPLPLLETSNVLTGSYSWNQDQLNFHSIFYQGKWMTSTFSNSSENTSISLFFENNLEAHFVLLDTFESPSSLEHVRTIAKKNPNSSLNLLDSIFPSIPFSNLIGKFTTWVNKKDEEFQMELNLNDGILHLPNSSESIELNLIVRPHLVQVETNTLVVKKKIGTFYYGRFYPHENEFQWYLLWNDESIGKLRFLKCFSSSSHSSVSTTIEGIWTNTISTWIGSNNQTIFLKMDSNSFTYTVFYFPIVLNGPMSSDSFPTFGTFTRVYSSLHFHSHLSLTGLLTYLDERSRIQWYSLETMIDEWILNEVRQQLTVPLLLFDSATGLKIILTMNTTSQTFETREFTEKPEYIGRGNISFQEINNVFVHFDSTGQNLYGRLTTRGIQWNNGNSWKNEDYLIQKQTANGLANGLANGFQGTPCDDLLQWTHGMGGIEILHDEIGLVMSFNSTLFWGVLSENQNKIDWGSGCSWNTHIPEVPRVFYDEESSMKISVHVDSNGNFIANEVMARNWGTTIGKVVITEHGIHLEAEFNGIKSIGELADDASEIMWNKKTRWISEITLLSSQWTSSSSSVSQIHCSTVNNVVIVNKEDSV